jgi:ribonuclease BN (tRNA processing enzyme)
VRYGGNTSCVEVRAADGTVLVLDAGTGIRRLGDTIGTDLSRVDILLTHLHLDHIQGLGFFEPLFRKDLEVHVWGPASTTLDLAARLGRYLSPPLFPVHLRDVPCRLTLHDVVAVERFDIGPFKVEARLVCHPGPTVGYRIEGDGASVAYLPDHEPALGARDFPGDPEWLSGFGLAAGVDLLIHDAQYTVEQYDACIGWGHSTIPQALAFARAAAVGKLVLFHHDPTHSDIRLDGLFDELLRDASLPFEVIPAVEGASFDVG